MGNHSLLLHWTNTHLPPRTCPQPYFAIRYLVSSSSSLPLVPSGTRVQQTTRFAAWRAVQRDPYPSRCSSQRSYIRRRVLPT